jgi:hypothetical protein
MGQVTLMENTKTNNIYQTEVSMLEDTKQNLKQNTTNNASCFNRVVKKCVSCIPFIFGLGFSIIGGGAIGSLNGGITVSNKAVTIVDMPPIPKSEDELYIFANGTSLIHYNRDLIEPTSVITGAIVGGLSYIIHKLAVYGSSEN